MEKERLTRSEMLDLIIDEDIEDLSNEGVGKVELYLREVLLNGTIGYNAMSDGDLCDFYQLRGGGEAEIIPE